MKFGEMFQIVKTNYRMFGPVETAASVLMHLLIDELLSEQRFDRRYGVETHGVVTPEAAGIEDDKLRFAAILYVPIRERVADMLIRDQLKQMDASKLTFVDLGCGKARALLIASRFPFARIMGVEISEQLAEIGRENVRRYMHQPRPVTPIRCQQVAIECMSATTCNYPDTNDLLVFMYRPFTGEVFTAAIDNLARFHRETGRKVTIILCCPIEEYLLEQHASFRKINSYRVIDPEFNAVIYETMGEVAQA